MGGSRKSKVLAPKELTSKHQLQEIMDNLPRPTIVIDPQGNIIFSNSSTALTIGISLDQLLKSNINNLVEQGYFNNSYAMEAAEKKTVVSGVIKTKLNFEMYTVNTPILDQNGEVRLILMIGNPKEEIDHHQTEEMRKYENNRKREIEYLRSIVLDKDTVIAHSPSTQRALLSAHSVAQTDSAVLFYGETGTGKEVFTKYIHRHSKRSNEAFIAVNCAAFPEGLVESELFGYEKGAFTGASSEGKIGLFEAADRGTLFLDEIAELPLPLQSKLLRVLETGEVRRIGSYIDRKIDFRLISATHKDLEKLSQENLFRQDLFFRLNVFPITIPPLRERLEDIEALSHKYLEDFNKKYNTEVTLDKETLQFFSKYNWPGNVRELRNIIERKVISSLDNYNHDYLPLAAANPKDSLIEADWIKPQYLTGNLRDVLKTVEELYINYVLRECGGKIGVTAERLGIYRTVLYRKLKAFRKDKE